MKMLQWRAVRLLCVLSWVNNINYNPLALLELIFIGCQFISVHVLHVVLFTKSDIWVSAFSIMVFEIECIWGIDYSEDAKDKNEHFEKIETACVCEGVISRVMVHNKVSTYVIWMFFLDVKKNVITSDIFEQFRDNHWGIKSYLCLFSLHLQDSLVGYHFPLVVYPNYSSSPSSLARSVAWVIKHQWKKWWCAAGAPLVRGSKSKDYRLSLRVFPSMAE